MPFLIDHPLQVIVHLVSIPTFQHFFCARVHP